MFSAHLRLELEVCRGGIWEGTMELKWEKAGTNLEVSWNLHGQTGMYVSSQDSRNNTVCPAGETNAVCPEA